MGSDRGQCADVGPLRVCWDASCPDGVCTTPRQTPEASLALAGFRCYGEGRQRRCQDRARNASPFSCHDDTCVQPHARLPDDGEWECFDRHGGVICKGGEPPSGVAPGAGDPGWICGTRQGGESNERICLDLSPDLPERADAGYRCRMDNDVVPRRICRRQEGAPDLGRGCADGATCPVGLACIAGHCLPRLRPLANCWFDSDCGDGGQLCRLGACVEGGP